MTATIRAVVLVTLMLVSAQAAASGDPTPVPAAQTFCAIAWAYRDGKAQLVRVNDKASAAEAEAEARAQLAAIKQPDDEPVFRESQIAVRSGSGAAVVLFYALTDGQPFESPWGAETVPAAIKHVMNNASLWMLPTSARKIDLTRGMTLEWDSTRSPGSRGPGNGTIKKVEVSADGGQTWGEAALSAPVLPRAVTRFRMAWRWDGSPAILKSRATDDRGAVQPERAKLIAEHGSNVIVHFNGVQAWRVEANGEVKNVYA